MNHIAWLSNKGVIKPPYKAQESVQYEVVGGSTSYGMATDNSDLDLISWMIPSKGMIFPHLQGEVPGFGSQHQRFEVFQNHHCPDPDGQPRTYDIQCYNIVKYFQLAMENNMNIIDTLFVPANCVTFSTQLGDLVRSNRRLFLHKGSMHKAKGYAFSQLKKIEVKDPAEGSKRWELKEKYGFDVKFASHTCRLLLQAQQILEEEDLDLQRNKEYLSSIRRGEVPLEDIKRFVFDKDAYLEKLYTESKLRHSPDEEAIKQLLLSVLESYYGSIDKAIVQPDQYLHKLKKIKELVEDI